MDETLFNTDKKAFVLAWLKSQGLSPRNVEAYRPGYRKESVEHEGWTLTVADREGGCEGDGEYMDFTFKLEKDDEFLHFQVTGVYNSWDASEWDDDLTIVEAREVLVTQWFAA